MSTVYGDSVEPVDNLAAKSIVFIVSFMLFCNVSQANAKYTGLKVRAS